VTKSFQAPFTSEELGERFANALNYCLDSLASQKGLKLKVNNPEAYNFDPRLLLQHIVTMYANMAGEDVFLMHVVDDSRSYKTETFEKTVRILGNPGKGVVVDAESRDRFEDLVQRLKSMKVEIDQEDDLYDDAPEEFLDTLMSTLMKDPVELPSSKNVVDFMTISKTIRLIINFV
jgi:ubiquitin conjugation factor E4 B